jgi:hypothetical protein
MDAVACGKSLVVAEGGDEVGSGGAAGGDVAGGEGHDGEKQGHDGEGDGVCGLGAEEHGTVGNLHPYTRESKGHSVKICARWRNLCG